PSCTRNSGKEPTMGNRLFVGNLADSVRDEVLRQHFTGFGTVTSAKVMIDRDTGVVECTVHLVDRRGLLVCRDLVQDQQMVTPRHIGERVRQRALVSPASPTFGASLSPNVLPRVGAKEALHVAEGSRPEPCRSGKRIAQIARESLHH